MGFGRSSVIILVFIFNLRFRFLIYSAIILPVVTAFIEVETLDTWFFFDIFMDAVFFSDVIINLLSAYTHDEILVTNHWVYIYF